MIDAATACSASLTAGCQLPGEKTCPLAASRQCFGKGNLSKSFQYLTETLANRLRHLPVTRNLKSYK